MSSRLSRNRSETLSEENIDRLTIVVTLKIIKITSYRRRFLALDVKTIKRRSK